MSPDLASSERSTMHTSPNSIPATVMAVPVHLTRKVASGFFTSMRLRSTFPTEPSPIGDGDPQGTRSSTQVIAVTLSAGAKPSGSSSSQRQDSRTADRDSRAGMTENLFLLDDVNDVGGSRNHSPSRAGVRPRKRNGERPRRTAPRRTQWLMIRCISPSRTSPCTPLRRSRS